jgi:hypothetical protein
MNTEYKAIEIEDTPGSALALIDGMADDKLFSPGSITDTQLATMRSDWLAEAKKYDISTEPKRTELKRFARPLQKLRTGIETRAKELTGATKRKIAAIDTEKRRLVLVVGGIEDEVLAPLIAWEQEEETRKISLSAQVSYIVESGNLQNYPDIASLGVGIAKLEAFDLSAMQEFKISAESALVAVLKVLKPELERRKVAEAERVELEKLRADAAARDAQARIDFATNEAREQAKREAADEVVAAERRAQDAEAKAKSDKFEAEQRRIAEVKESQARETAAVFKAAREREQAVEDERKRVADEEEAIRAAAALRATNVKHREKVNQQAQAGLFDHCQLSLDVAGVVIDAISKGLIPHVTITY